jgi:hypothetical protein
LTPPLLADNISGKGGTLRNSALVFFAVVVVLLSATGCRRVTAPEEDTLYGTYDATKAEFVSVANPSTKEDVAAQGWSVVLVLSANSLSLTFTPTSDPSYVATGTWSISIDVMTVNWTSVFSGESEFEYWITSDQLILTGGHVPYEFAVGNPEEAILNLILTKR